MKIFSWKVYKTEDLFNSFLSTLKSKINWTQSLCQNAQSNKSEQHFCDVGSHGILRPSIRVRIKATRRDARLEVTHRISNLRGFCYLELIAAHPREVSDILLYIIYFLKAGKCTHWEKVELKLEEDRVSLRRIILNVIKKSIIVIELFATNQRRGHF